MSTPIERSIFLDYSRGVYRKVARHVPTTRTERDGLEVGHQVAATGDDHSQFDSKSLAMSE